MQSYFITAFLLLINSSLTILFIPTVDSYCFTIRCAFAEGGSECDIVGDTLVFGVVAFVALVYFLA
jgi:hypothetical protein